MGRRRRWTLLALPALAGTAQAAEALAESFEALTPA